MSQHKQQESLPQPDGCGNYWLHDGVIFASSWHRRRGLGDKWFASNGQVARIGGDIRYFDSPEEALEWIRSKKT